MPTSLLASWKASNAPTQVDNITSIITQDGQVLHIRADCRCVQQADSVYDNRYVCLPAFPRCDLSSTPEKQANEGRRPVASLRMTLLTCANLCQDALEKAASRTRGRVGAAPVLSTEHSLRCPTRSLLSPGRELQAWRPICARYARR